MSLTPEEIEIRRHSIGSSDIAAVMGVNPYRSKHDVYLSKLGLAEFVDNDAVEAGNDFEPIIIKRFARHHNVEVTPGHYVRGGEPWVSATPDAFIVGGGIVEAKMIGFDTAYQWTGEADGAPWMYLMQTQWQLLVTKEPFAVIAAQMGTRAPRYIRVDPDRDLQGMMLDSARTFWFEHVSKQSPPEVDHTEGATRMLKRLYPADRRAPIVADEEMHGIAQKLLATRLEFDRVTDRERLLENQIKERMQDAEAVIGDGYRITWKKSRNGQRPFKFTHKDEKNRKVAA